MNNVRLKHILLPALFFMAMGCTKNFESINTDPNRPKTVMPGAILDQVQYYSINSNLYNGAWGLTHELMQVHAPGVSTAGGGIHRYELLAGIRTWNYWEYGTIKNIEEVYTLGDQLSEDNYKAIALVYKCWLYSIMTDLYGDIPYSEAMRADEGIFQPVFDKQKDIYIGMLADLDKANDLFNDRKALTYGGDLLYNANSVNSGGVNVGIQKWKRFCNSLKLRLLLRISARDGEIDVNNQINAMLANPGKYPVFGGNDEEAIFRYTGAYPLFSPFHNARQLDWSETVYFTRFFVDKLNMDEDPRRAVWMSTVPVGGQNIYQGIESGYPTTHPIYLAGQNSTYPAALKTFPMLGVMMTYAELEFIKAELALKGFNTGRTARQHYESGIRASMTQWGVGIPSDFFSRPGVAYNEAASLEAQLEQIIHQKYYAFFFTDFQAWFEKKRTGYPVLPRGEGIPVENQFPNRMFYPSSLQSSNPKNLAAAIKSMGGDRSDVKVWWQK